MFFYFVFTCIQGGGGGDRDGKRGSFQVRRASRAGESKMGVGRDATERHDDRKKLVRV